MCHPNAGILGGSFIFPFISPPAVSPPAVFRRRWPSARAAARGLGGVDVSASRAAVLFASWSRRCSTAASSAAVRLLAFSRSVCSARFFSALPPSERASGVGVVGGVGPPPPSRASSPPRIHASGTTLSLYSACSARNGPRPAHAASRRCPASRRWRMRGVDDTHQRISAASDPVAISPARVASAATTSPSPHSRRLTSSTAPGFPARASSDATRSLVQQPSVWQPRVDSRAKGSEVEAASRGDVRRRLLGRRGDDDDRDEEEDGARAGRRGTIARTCGGIARGDMGARGVWGGADTRGLSRATASWLFLGGDAVAAVDSHGCVQLCPAVPREGFSSARGFVAHPRAR